LDHGNFSWAGESVTRKTRILKVVYNSTNNELVRTNTLVKGSIIQIDSTPFKAWYLQYYNVDLSNKKSADKAKAAASAKKEAKEKSAAKTAGKKEATTKKEEKTGKKEATKKEAPKKKDDKPAGKKEATTKKEEKTGKKEATKKEPAQKPKTGEAKAKGSKGKPALKKQEDTERTDLNKKALAKFSKRNSTRKLDSALGDQFKTGRVYAKISSRPGQSGRCDGYIIEGEELAFYLKKINLKKKK